ncbi:hypothetical protein M409DRAFT_57608 [Zasmidium cellare ATCC 36951]|uniref:Uncharacterized protein n=1 Tax=Zasmidium cellare ATCC 36951 TaxID=1080233 RepID=A0A6A6C912_ZASCE|nr:uncharacterized protein M409DRAFT_57608 [Zasmidium cellare ATCC 36951]KAF2163323.1 hypothetical protein M409DRAFT_57608 [Zasmidium cellare ATCC 36951]
MDAERMPVTFAQELWESVYAEFSGRTLTYEVTISNATAPPQEAHGGNALSEDDYLPAAVGDERGGALSKGQGVSQEGSLGDSGCDYPHHINCDEASSEDDWALVRGKSDGDGSEDDVARFEQNKPSEGRPPSATLLTLPVELHLEIFSHLTAHYTSTNNITPVDIAGLSAPHTLPSKEHHLPKSYSFLLTNTLTHADLIIEINKSHPLIFYNLSDLQAWVRNMRKATQVILDLGDVSPKIMRKALYTFRDLPKLEAIEVRCTPRNREAVCIPPGWKGFPALERATITDPKLEAEQTRAHVENQGLLKTTIQKIKSLRDERDTFTQDSPRVKEKISRIPAPRRRANPVHQQALIERRIGTIMMYAMVAIDQELKRARLERVRLETEFPKPEFCVRCARLGFQGMFLKDDVRLRREARALVKK